MVGGESRKSRRPCAVTVSRAFTSSSCAPKQPDVSRKNTNLKRLTSFIARNSLNKGTAQGKQVSKYETVITSSEKAGDVIVDNSFMRMVGGWTSWLGSPNQGGTWRDRRTLRGDRLRSSTHHQRESINIRMRSNSPAEPTVPNRNVSKVSAQASNKIGAQLALLYRSM